MLPNDVRIADGGRNQAHPVQQEAVQLDGQSEIVVQREWNGWRTAIVRLSDLEDIQWLQPEGAPRPLIHAHVCCTKLVSGDIPHDCSPAQRPHYLLVCVLKSHTAPRVFLELTRRANERQRRDGRGIPVGS